MEFVVSRKKRHMWNIQIAELRSENGSSGQTKDGTFDDICIPSEYHVEKPAESHERKTWQKSTIYRAKHSRITLAAAFTKIQRRFHCPQTLRSVLLDAKQLPINSKASFAPLSDQAVRDQKAPPSVVSPSKHLPPNEDLPKPARPFVNASVHAQVEQEM